MNKKKILHVIGGMGRGGAPIFIVNNLQHIDVQLLQFDFLCRKDNCSYYETIQAHGGNVIIVPPFPSRLFSNFIKTYKFFKEHASEYEAIHVHANALYYILPFIFGKWFGIKKLILHSHNTKSNIGIMTPLHYFNRLFVDKLANVHLACGQEAGRWMYQDRPFEVINNAVDVRKFEYNEVYRNEIRKFYGIQDDVYVIGNVGRFEMAKNHKFIIDVFRKYHERNPKSVLLLVGDGSLIEQIRERVDAYGLSNSVVFAGLRSDIEKIYSAFDLFFLPSLFEGLPFVLIEAQCSGVQCLVSDAVTKEAYITDLIKALNLSASEDTWVKAICAIANNRRYSRNKYAEIIQEKHYDVRDTAARLTEIYTQ